MTENPLPDLRTPSTLPFDRKPALSYLCALATLEIRGKGDNCTAGYRYKVWYYPEGGGSTLLADNLVTPRVILPGTPVGAGHGRYTFVEYDPATGNGPVAVPMVMNDQRNSQGEAGEQPGVLAWNRTEYLHADHLGSTRLVTDEDGAVAAAYKFYPFGHYADSSSGSNVRMKFTGHERDEATQLDYMFARYSGPQLGRFLSVDPLLRSASPEAPQSWTRYAYARNNPVNRIDPDGQKDKRTKEEKEMTEDETVLVAVGETVENIEETGYEWGFNILPADKGDWITTEPRTDGSYKKVGLNGAYIRVHGHVPKSKLPHGVNTEPNKASPKDKSNASTSGKNGYTLAPKSMIRVDPSEKATKILTKKDWKEYLQRARSAWAVWQQRTGGKKARH